MKGDTIRAIRDFADHGIHPGGFLERVLCNDLQGAFGAADSDNFANMGEIVRYCYNAIPASCWGSEERFAAWLRKFAAAEAAKEIQREVVAAFDAEGGAA